LRIKVKIAYNGRDFYGSQEQNSKKTVAGELNNSLKRLNIFEKVVLSGRTDRNVHATGQVFHVDIPDFWNLEKFKVVFERPLSNSISIISIDEVSKDFHARFSAKKRVYRYIFSFQKRDPFRDGFLTFLENKPFDFTKVKRAIKLFQGTHNFENFRKSGSKTHTDFRTIYETKAYKVGGIYVFKFVGNSFLRSQIRMISQFLIEIGFGKFSENELLKQLNSEKIFSTDLAPANGLYLTKVIYD
jgi:tRNA pseudouridine38-40 synthase